LTSLGQGAAALDDPPCAQIAPQRTRNPAPVDAVMLVEAPILGRHDRIDHLLRNPVQRDQPPVFAGRPVDHTQQLGIEKERVERFATPP
jgi:hypothetical protein